jgi:hypothetical protein
MYKKITMALAIAAILTAYIAGLVLSNEAFAQPFPLGPFPTSTNQPIYTGGQPHVPHVGQVLGGINTAIDHILYSNPGMIGYSGLLAYLPGGDHQYGQINTGLGFSPGKELAGQLGANHLLHDCGNIHGC